ncbi:MAG: HD-GYP domain-containing protein [Actinomycetota bacterium]|nr:HD-GYP domain-containing protein [Actinomycetota bacterium]
MGEHPTSLHFSSYLLQVTAATLLVVVCPISTVSWLYTSGTVQSPVVGMALGMALALGLSYLGSAFWQTRSGSGDVLFGDLLIWGFVRRWRRERRLSSALERLESVGVSGGLSVENQGMLLEALAKRLEARDHYTNGHSRRVARHSWIIARRMGLPREQVARIRKAAAVHDVGKIETPRVILNKAGRLTDAEFDVIKRHPLDGARMAAVFGDAELTSIVRHHHERLDGTGYPNGLSGREIPLGARIIAVADTFDAITSARPYRSARPRKNAIDIIRNEAGTQLDLTVVRAFCGQDYGRRPVALWAAVRSLPERVNSRLVAGVTSSAQMLAVTVAVGTAAAAVPSLVLPVTKSHHPARTVAAGHALTARATPAQVSIGARTRATPRRRHFEQGQAVVGATSRAVVSLPSLSSRLRAPQVAGSPREGGGAPRPSGSSPETHGGQGPSGPSPASLPSGEGGTSGAPPSPPSGSGGPTPMPAPLPVPPVPVQVPVQVAVPVSPLPVPLPVPPLLVPFPVPPLPVPLPVPVHSPAPLP